MSVTPPRSPESPGGASRPSREDITSLVREEAARRRTSETTAHIEEGKSRLPYRTIGILVLITVILVAGTRGAMEIVVLLRHPGDAPVRSIRLDDMAALVPATSIELEDKTLVIHVSATWESYDRNERSIRFAKLCGILANRSYHAARLVAPNGADVGHWGHGLIQVQ